MGFNFSSDQSCVHSRHASGTYCKRDLPEVSSEIFPVFCHMDFGSSWPGPVWDKQIYPSLAEETEKQTEAAPNPEPPFLTKFHKVSRPQRQSGPRNLQLNSAQRLRDGQHASLLSHPAQESGQLSPKESWPPIRIESLVEDLAKQCCEERRGN